MSLPLPQRLSPSKVSSYVACPKAFQFATIDGLRDPGTVATERGSLVHSALERLFTLPAEMRTVEAAVDCLEIEFDLMCNEDDFIGLHLTDLEVSGFYCEALALIEAYFTLEDPRTIEPVGIELAMELEIDGVRIKGIIDRLDMEDGELVVVDYKSAPPPAERYTQQKMVGVHIYSLFCEEMFGVRPKAVKLYHLGTNAKTSEGPTIITVTPTEGSSRVTRAKIGGIWQAIVRACANDDFRPKVGPLCNYCNFESICPARGGAS